MLVGLYKGRTLLLLNYKTPSEISAYWRNGKLGSNTTGFTNGCI